MNNLNFKTMVTALFALFLVAQSLVAQADSDKRFAKSAEIVVQALESHESVPEIIQTIVFNLRKELGVCKRNLLLSYDSMPACIRGIRENDYQGESQKYIEAAFRAGKIDRVEAALLKRLMTAVVSVKGDSLEDIVISERPLMSIAEGRGVKPPSLVEYRARKASFRALRKSKGREEILPVDLLKTMAQLFRRKMKGAGEINAEEYLASKMGRLQLNLLAGTMVSATDFLARPSALMVFYPANYSANQEKLKTLQSQAIAIAQGIAATESAEQRALLQNHLKGLQKKIEETQHADQIDLLSLARTDLNKKLQAVISDLADQNINDQRRSELGAELTQTLQALSEIDKKLALLIRTRAIPPEDVKRFAMNSLKEDFISLTQDEPFKSMNLNLADTLLAAWVSGDISSEAVLALAHASELKEENINVWQKALSIGWSIGRTSLMAYPSTSYIAIAISIFMDVRRETNMMREKKSRETHLIPNN